MRYWTAIGKIRVMVPETVLPRTSLNDVLAGQCMCGGYLERIAFRYSVDEGRPWVPFGYRCSACKTLYVDEKE